MSPNRLILAVVVLYGLACPSWSADPKPEQIDHFEKSVRPILVDHCYSCHSADAKKLKGGLRLDSRKHLIEGGDNGPAIVSGEPDKSRFIEAVRYTNTDLLMPPKGKLSEDAIRTLEAWVRAGAPWPNEAAKGELKNEFDLAKRRREHWAWQPLPVNHDTKTTVDDHIRRKLSEAEIQPAPAASKLTFLRRVTFALIGLPPTPEEVIAFEKDDSPDAYGKVVDRLLASPHFGERWGRHWLDLVRYAESRGHEFEPDIPNAYQYRDYVVRALNSDVPYNQFVLEHLAGDVLANPRIDPKTGANESAIGPAFWHLGEEVHSPVDIRQDQADRFDNRIDVATKAFLGLTVSCARCHDHKFDAISTKDYYALFGLLEGASYRQVRIDGWKQNREVAAELEGLRNGVNTTLQHPTYYAKSAAEPDAAYQRWVAAAKPVIDYNRLKPGQWLPDDVTFGTGPVKAGCRTVRRTNTSWRFHFERRTAAMFDPFWANLKLAPNTANDYGPLGKTTRAGFTIRTPSFVLEKKKLHYLVRGGGVAYAAVAQHAVLGGPLHQSIVMPFKNDSAYRWVSHDVGGYVGQRLHVELTADPTTPFAIALVMQSDDNPPGVPPEDLNPEFSDGKDAEFTVYGKGIEQAEQKLAAKVKWESRLALSMWDGPSVDSPVFVRGNPRTPGPIVPHRSLEALAGAEKIKHGTGSGRLELARQWIDPTQTPLIARVAVNRVWHHLFGRGLVPSTDNFGVLGERPTHPELLDQLANEFVADGWSVKRLVRRLVLTDTYRMSSTADAAAVKADPSNQLLHTFRLKRLDGETIRDTMLSVSDRLDRTIGGPSVPIHLTPFLDGRGRPAVSGPIDGDGRRSIYLAVRRNFLSPFLLAFDTPIPFSTVGRRQVSNVPAQALILMNDPFVHEQAERWAKVVLSKPGTLDERVTAMYRTAYGRSPTADELRTCAEFVTGKESDPTAWKDFAHTLFNVKEFVFIK